MFTRSAKPRHLENIRRLFLCLFWQTHLTLTMPMAGVLHSGLRNMLWSGTRLLGWPTSVSARFGTRRWWTIEGDSGARCRLWSIHQPNNQGPEPKHPFLSHGRTGCRRNTFSGLPLQLSVRNS
ncbi:hypothetical protein BC567DRAFT_225010 [Phyllosticta citribraziliensis]